MDFGEYRKLIVNAVKDVSAKDPNWDWHVNRINKKSVHIRWGYLNYIGQKEDFTFFLFEDGVERDLVGSLHGAIDWHDEDLDDVFVTIGDKHWHDAKTMTEAIPMMINQIARLAHARY